jgi:hypothetical protein
MGHTTEIGENLPIYQLIKMSVGEETLPTWLPNVHIVPTFYYLALLRIKIYVKSLHPQTSCLIDR